MKNGSSLPPDLAGFLDEARSGAPEPSNALRERLHARLQTSIAAGTGEAADPSADLAASEGSAAASSATSTTTAASALTSTLTKVGLVLLLAVGGYIALRAAAPSARGKAAVAPAALSKPASIAVTSPALTPKQEPTAKQEPTPKQEPTAKQEPRRAPKRAANQKPLQPHTSPHSHPVDPLELEHAMLEKARAQLPLQPKIALRRLQEHAQRFPSGQLAEERELLRARAHLAAGDLASARNVARRFLKSFPRSVNRREITTIGNTP